MIRKIIDLQRIVNLLNSISMNWIFNSTVFLSGNPFTHRGEPEGRFEGLRRGGVRFPEAS
jgi:hypothetical protein